MFNLNAFFMEIVNDLFEIGAQEFIEMESIILKSDEFSGKNQNKRRNKNNKIISALNTFGRHLFRPVKLFLASDFVLRGIECSTFLNDIEKL